MNKIEFKIICFSIKFITNTHIDYWTHAKRNLYFQ